MPKPKPTISEKLEASAIVQRLIENYGQKHYNEVSDGVAAELNRIYERLLKADERLLQPKPRKPKAEHVGSEAATGKIERWGRDGRKDKS